MEIITFRGLEAYSAHFRNGKNAARKTHLLEKEIQFSTVKVSDVISILADVSALILLLSSCWLSKEGIESFNQSQMILYKVSLTIFTIPLHHS